MLFRSGLRVKVDLRNEKINYKIRDHSLTKIPIIAVVGANEIEARTVAVRRLGGKDQEILALTEAVDRLNEETAPPTIYSPNDLSRNNPKLERRTLIARRPMQQPVPQKGGRRINELITTSEVRLVGADGELVEGPVGLEQAQHQPPCAALATC